MLGGTWLDTWLSSLFSSALVFLCWRRSGETWTQCLILFLENLASQKQFLWTIYLFILMRSLFSPQTDMHTHTHKSQNVTKLKPTWNQHNVPVAVDVELGRQCCINTIRQSFRLQSSGCANTHSGVIQVWRGLPEPLVSSLHRATHKHFRVWPLTLKALEKCLVKSPAPYYYRLCVHS